MNTKEADRMYHRVSRIIDYFKELCISAPILVYADFLKPFKLLIDASGIGFGTVLCQEQGGIYKVTTYAS